MSKHGLKQDFSKAAKALHAYHGVVLLLLMLFLVLMGLALILFAEPEHGIIGIGCLGIGVGAFYQLFRNRVRVQYTCNRCGMEWKGIARIPTNNRPLCPRCGSDDVSR